MVRYESFTCSYPNCCRQIHLSAQDVRSVTYIQCSSCTVLRGNPDVTTVYYNRNKSLTRLYTDQCCGGEMYVYIDQISTQNHTFVYDITKTEEASQGFISTAFNREETKDSLCFRNIPFLFSLTINILLFVLLLIMFHVAWRIARNRDSRYVTTGDVQRQSDSVYTELDIHLEGTESVTEYIEPVIWTRNENQRHSITDEYPRYCEVIA